MSSLNDVSARFPVVLAALTAQDLMTPKPLSIPEKAHVADAARLLTKKHFSAVPVVNAAGRPVGVLSRADIVRHACECLERAREAPDQEPDAILWALGPMDGLPLPAKADATEVRLVMTPIICTVAPETPALRVVEEMLAREVHRLFVVRGEALIGVITTMDVMRKLRSSEAPVAESAGRSEPHQAAAGMSVAEQFRQAHANLLQELRTLHAVAGPASKTSAGELVSHLRTMRAVLGQHFRLEEGNGYMENVRRRQPQADHAIQKLQSEHRELLSELDKLIAQAQTPSGTRESIGPKIKAWTAQVRAHESHENTLVQDAFNLDISAED